MPELASPTGAQRYLWRKRTLASSKINGLVLSSSLGSAFANRAEDAYSEYWRLPFMRLSITDPMMASIFSLGVRKKRHQVGKFSSRLPFSEITKAGYVKVAPRKPQTGRVKRKISPRTGEAKFPLGGREKTHQSGFTGSAVTEECLNGERPNSQI